MTKVKVYAGICGFTTIIEAEDQGAYQAVIKINSQCQNWTKVNETLDGKPLDAMQELFKNKDTGRVDSEFIDLSLTMIPHVSCPVISGVLKALEVSVGLALPKDAEIRFVSEET
jgi:hypothetical protein